MTTKLAVLAVIGMLAGSSSAFAGDATYTLEMKGGAYVPSELAIPAGQKVHIIVKNEEKVQTEFESYKLDKEVKIEPGEQTDIYVGPLDAGEYDIFDDNNPDTKGKVVAK